MKAFTNVEQSKKLAEILPLESADMWYWEFPTAPTYNGYGYPMFHKGEDIRNVPCWSLAALLDALPEGVIENYYAPNLQKENGKYSIAYGNEELLCIADNPIDACYEMIIKLSELKML